MYDDLRDHIRCNLVRCRGNWIPKKNGYESDLCQALGIEHETHAGLRRYRDATWRGYSIELKKGTSIWLDLVRYCEVLLEKPELNSERGVCLFCVPDKPKTHLLDVIGVSTPRLLKKLAISEAQAKALLQLRDHVPRQLNAQASLTVSDVRAISEFSVARCAPMNGNDA